MGVASLVAACEAEGPSCIFPEMCSASATRLTVWCKSLLFHGDGYTVYDAAGRMVFRVDNYAHDRSEEAVLMDSSGDVLLTIRRCRKSLFFTDSWEAYKGSIETSGDNPGGRRATCPLAVLRAAKTLGDSSCTVTMASTGYGLRCHYRVIWSRQKGYSKIYRGGSTSDQAPIAEVCRKTSSTAEGLLGKDVLSMHLEPNVDRALVMAMVMIADAMRRSNSNMLLTN